LICLMRLGDEFKLWSSSLYKQRNKRINKCIRAFTYHATRQNQNGPSIHVAIWGNYSHVICHLIAVAM
jgi:hypothetical protein